MSRPAGAEVRIEGGVTVVRFRGEIDFAAAAELEERVRLAVRDAAAVVLDLADVTFIDSAGVRLLDHVAADLGDRTPWLVATADPCTVRFTLSLCGFPGDRMVATADAALGVLRDRVPDDTPADAGLPHPPSKER